MSKRKLEVAATNSMKITSFFTPQPKMQKTTLSTSVSPPKGPFDKQKWIQSLTDQQKELLDLEIKTLDDSWLSVLHTELTKPYFLDLKRFLKTQYANKKTIFPPTADIYSWSRLTPLNDVKVVILGQDPYHNVNQAHGLAFSVQPPSPAPPSLRNIFKCLQKCYPDFRMPKSGLLTPWAKQGVLLLNACLTVEAHQANSHAGKGWETFTEKVLAAAAANRQKGICFMAWGTPASKRVDGIKPGPQHLVLKAVHPSPLSASRGFFDCEHFTKANDYLEKRYGPENIINWALDPGNKLDRIERVKAKAKKNAEDEKENIVNVEPGEKTPESEEEQKVST